MPTRRFRSVAPVDLVRTIGFLAMGRGDPSIRIAGGEAWIATRTPEGPATVRLSPGEEMTAEAWGPGAAWALESAPGLSGALDDPAGFEPSHPALRDAARRMRGVRITRSGRVVEMMLRTIVAQRVTGKEAKRSYAAMTRALGEPAPGPEPLLLPPDPARVAACGYTAFHPWGIERARADVLIGVAGRAKRLEEAAGMSHQEARARMTAIRGVGEWTAAKVAAAALGDADAVPVGDFHLPNAVAFALAGEPRADDRRMLELLEEYRPHRARVIRILQAAGLHAPKYGPRSQIRSIRDK